MTDHFVELPSSIAAAKAQAKRLKSALAPDYPVAHGQSLELVARIHGEESWGRLRSRYASLTDETSADIDISKTKSGEKLVERSASEHRRGNHLDQKQLKALSTALKNRAATVVTRKTQTKTKSLHNEEIISVTELESWLDTIDPNLGTLAYNFGIDSLLMFSNVRAVSRMKRPKNSDEVSIGDRGLRPAGFAAVLIWLERMGLDTHPEAFYEPLLGRIRSSQFIDSDELHCLWHSTGNDDRFQTNEHFVDSKVRLTNSSCEVVDRPNGLRTVIVCDPEPGGLIESIRIYRRD